MITNPSEWFIYQLKASTDGVVWAFRQIPGARLDATPPVRLGEWTASRHAFHLLYYERGVALPSLKHWLGEPYPTFEGYDEAAAWGEGGHDLESVLEEFQMVRAEQIALLGRVSDAPWEEVGDSAWGNKTLYWVVSKTYQHGIEHLSAVLRMAMLWDHYEARERAR